MLFKRTDLERLRDGEVSRAYRRWRAPRAKPGGAQRTRLGVVHFEAVERVNAARLTDADARAAGRASRERLLAELKRGKGDVYRIDLAWAGADPRVELRERKVSPQEVGEIAERLAAMDARSPRGPWTIAMLELLAAKEGVRAADLAAGQGREKLPFKRDVRKLKELGLTQSLEVGYRLSPRGRTFLERRGR